MIKRILLVSVIWFAILFTASCERYTTIYAQTLPITINFVWDANEPADGVINYIFTVDGVVVSSPIGTSASATISSYGLHTFSVAARNAFTTGVASTLTVNVGQPKPVTGFKFVTGN